MGPVIVVSKCINCVRLALSRSLSDMRDRHEIVLV